MVPSFSLRTYLFLPAFTFSLLILTTVSNSFSNSLRLSSESMINTASSGHNNRFTQHAFLLCPTISTPLLHTLVFTSLTSPSNYILNTPRPTLQRVKKHKTFFIVRAGLLHHYRVLSGHHAISLKRPDPDSDCSNQSRNHRNPLQYNICAQSPVSCCTMSHRTR